MADGPSIRPFKRRNTYGKEYSSRLASTGERLQTVASKFEDYKALLVEAAKDKRFEFDASNPESFVVTAQSCQDILKQMDEAHKHDSMLRKFGEMLKPVISGIQRYVSVVDTMVQSDPTVAALIWGGFKFILINIQDMEKQFSDLAEVLEALDPILANLGFLAKTFDWDVEVCNGVVKSYEYILRIWAAAMKLYRKRGVKKAVAELAKGIVSQKKREHIKLKDELDKVLKQLHECAARAKLDYDIAVNNRARIESWLPVSRDSYLEHCLSARYDGTCDWLFSNKTYSEWEDKRFVPLTGRRVLWLRGNPGMGKTILAASTVERLESKGDELQVVYYFFRDHADDDFRAGNKKTLISMLRSIILQLVGIIKRTRPHDFPKKFWAILDRSNGTALTDVIQAVDTVQILLELIPLTYVVIDGLDECSNRYFLPCEHSSIKEKLLPYVLQRLTTRDYNGQVHWFFTGCPEENLMDTFRAVKATSIRVGSSEVKDDILKYFFARFEKALGECSESACTMDSADSECNCITSPAMVTMARLGLELESLNFLDTRVTLDLLSKEMEFGVSTELYPKSEYSNKFEGRYMRGIERIASLNDEEQKLVRKVFMIMTVGERQFKRDELTQALWASSLAEEGLALHTGRRPVTPERLLGLCSPFLELQRSAEDGITAVRFIHRTASEFLTEPPTSFSTLSENAKRLFPSEAESHEELGLACLGYLLRSDHAAEPTAELKISLERDDPEFIFLKYASVFWHEHLSEAKPSWRIFNLIKKFVKSKKMFVSIWVASLYSPYRLARVTRGDEGMLQISGPNDVYPRKSDFLVADMLPKWIQNSEFGEEGKQLAFSCHCFIREFGQVLLLKPGGIEECNTNALGRHSDCFQQDAPKLLAYPFEDKEDKIVKVVAEGPKDSKQVEKHGLVLSQSNSGLVLRTFKLVKGASGASPGCFLLNLRDWEINLQKSRPRYSKAKPRCITINAKPASSRTNSDASAQVPPIFKTLISFNTENTKAALLADEFDNVKDTRLFDLSMRGVPMSHEIEYEYPLSASQLKDMDMNLLGKECVQHGSLFALSYVWVCTNKKGVQKGGSKPLRKSCPPDRLSSCDSDSDSDSGFEYSDSEESDSDDEDGVRSQKTTDSGYKSADAMSSEGSSASGTGETKGLIYLSIALLDNTGSSAKPKWHHFADRKSRHIMRQIKPCFHPELPILLLPSNDGVTIVDYELGFSRTVDVPAAVTEEPVSIISVEYRFSSNKNQLHRVTTTRSYENGMKWKISLENLTSTIDNGHNLSTVKIIQDPARKAEDLSIAWRSPYFDPHDIPLHPSLPFICHWSSSHLYICFGVCQVYLCRISLPPTTCSEEESASGSGVEVLGEPAYLPASTYEREFQFRPVRLGNEDHIVFAIAGGSDLPPAMIWKKVDDLGGWKAYDGPHIGQKGDIAYGPMRGIYSSDMSQFKLAVRSGLEWNRRYELVCGG